MALPISEEQQTTVTALYGGYSFLSALKINKLVECAFSGCAALHPIFAGVLSPYRGKVYGNDSLMKIINRV
jgi:hypothetical protein